MTSTTIRPVEIPNPYHRVIEPPRGWMALNLREVWEYRDLLFFMIWRDLKARYRQTALGPLWIIIQPFLSMVLYTLVFGLIAKLPSEGKPYAVFAYVALLPWNLFTTAVSSATNSFLSSIGLISKVYFPGLIIPLAQVVSALADFAISFVILLGMLFYLQITPTWGILLIPVFVVIAIVMGLGIGFWFSGVSVYYRDFTNLVGYFVRALMYASPVVYSITIIPEEWRTLYRLNPMTGVIEGFRWALLGTGQPPDWTLLLSLILFLPILIVGLYVHKRFERNIVDHA
jgi:lipopolysaccharide transport system permease protein